MFWFGFACFQTEAVKARTRTKHGIIFDYNAHIQLQSFPAILEGLYLPAFQQLYMYLSRIEACSWLQLPQKAEICNKHLPHGTAICQAWLRLTPPLTIDLLIQVAFRQTNQKQLSLLTTAASSEILGCLSINTNSTYIFAVRISVVIVICPTFSVQDNNISLGPGSSIGCRVIQWWPLYNNTEGKVT